MNVRKTIKKMLVYSPVKYCERLDALLRLTLLKPWIEKHQPHPYFAARRHLYAHVAETVIGNIPLSFLEFGVYQGASLQAWTKLNTADQSEFIGFDSFEGLPEAYVAAGGETLAKGSLSMGGDIPIMHRFSTDKQVVVHCDADVYSSTMFVLCKLGDLIKPGAIVIFDDFSSMLHDFRALEDYTRAFCRKYEVLGAAGPYYNHVAIRFTE
jgi:hypothetical protein